MRSFDVVVVGAGLAGLTTAYLLNQHAFTVQVLEARTRLGGRAFTIHDKHLDLHIDLGGAAVGSYHTAVRRWCDRLHVQLRPRLRTPFPELLPDRVILQGSPLDGRRLSRLRKELQSVVDELAGLAQEVDSVCPWHIHSARSHFDHISVDAWLLTQGFSRDLCTIFSDLAPGSQSLLGLLALVAGGAGRPFFTDSEAFLVENGTGSLVDALGHALGQTIRVGTPVYRLSQDIGTILVEASQEDGTVWCCRARAVVVAAPPPCWQHIAGFPQTILKLAPAMSQNRKLSLVVELEGDSSRLDDLFVLTDGPCRLIWGESHHTPGGKPFGQIHTLICPFLSTKAFTKQELIAQTMTLCGLDYRRRASYDQRWERSQWSQGAYVVFGPGNLCAEYSQVVDGLPPFFFAGDCVIPGYAGYMEGALQSAERTTAQVAHFLHRGPSSQRGLSA